MPRSVARNPSIAATASGSLELGRVADAGNVASFIAGATCCIFAAVSAVSRSLFSPRIDQQRLSGKRLEEWPQVDSGVAPSDLNGSAIAMS